MQIPEELPEDRKPTIEEIVAHGAAEAMFDAEILEALEEHFQTKVNNLSGDEMAEGPFEDGTEDGDLWEAAASRIDARGGLRVRFFFANQEGGR